MRPKDAESSDNKEGLFPYRGTKQALKQRYFTTLYKLTKLFFVKLALAVASRYKKKKNRDKLLFTEYRSWARTFQK